MAGLLQPHRTRPARSRAMDVLVAAGAHVLVPGHERIMVHAAPGGSQKLLESPYRPSLRFLAARMRRREFAAFRLRGLSRSCEPVCMGWKVVTGMRIVLINPVARRTQGYHTIGSHIAHLGLQVLARRTPPEHTVELVDEIFGAQDTPRLIRSGRFDLVAVTAYTSGAPRAYEIASLCRQQGVPCVMGGPHAWACPEEAAEHFDAVAVGESDLTWPRIVEDAARGRLEKFYRSDLPELNKGFGRADQRIQPVNGRYDVACIQAARGCPMGCDFCSVTRFNGPRIRHRDIGQIIDEWNEIAQPFVFIVDDNFFGLNKKHAEWSKHLLREIIRRGKRRLWFSQTTINVGEDAEALRLAYRAGCRGMLIGFETFNRETLEGYHKNLNRRCLDDYERLIRQFHRAGIGVFGAFIIGADQDDENTVADTALRAVRMGVDTIQFTNLTPLPGTKLYEQYLQEGRIFATNYPADWERYTFVETVFHPRSMTAQRLDESIYELRHAAATLPWVWKRTIRTFLRTRSVSTAIFIHGMNRGWKRMARIQAPKDAERFGFVPNGSPRVRKLRQAFGLFVS